MKLFTCVLAFAFVCRLEAQIPNPSFENWSSFGDFEDWSSTNLFIAGTVVQSSDARTGSYAARMTTYQAFSGNYGTSLESVIFDASTTESSLRGWYKANLQGGDRLYVGARITESGSDIQTGTGFVTSSSNIYTEFSVGMSIVGSGNPEWGKVTFMIYGPSTNSMSGTNANTWVLLDDISWGGPVSVEEIENTGTVLESIFPNPANGNPALVQFNMARPGHVLLEVFDLTGKKVSTVLNQVMPTGHYRAEMNTTEFAAGVYFCRMLVDGQLVQTLRFVN
jgi:hypothetical protein